MKKKNMIISLVLTIVLVLSFTQVVLANELSPNSEVGILALECPDCGNALITSAWHCYSAAGVDRRTHHCNVCGFGAYEERNCIH